MNAIQKIAAYCRVVFALDLRSLAAMRVALGLILLADVILRWPTISDMYTDDGVLPRPMMKQVWAAFDAVGLQQWGAGTWSLHALSGDSWWQYTLFVCGAVFAVMVVAGLGTRLAVIASFVLLVSAHNRIPFVLTSGDTHLRIVMFWAMFLPLGHVWSLDARRVGRTVRNLTSLSYVSPATAGLIVQIFILYFFSGLAKWNDAWWSGEGIFLAIHLTIYNTTFSQWFLQFPTACRIASIATVIAEVFLPWLLFVPFKNQWWRVINMIVFTIMHIGILLILSIGLFSYICIGIWVALMPGGFWNWVGKVFGREPLSRAATYLGPPRWTAPLQVFIALMIPFMLLWNVINAFPNWVSKPQFDPVRPDFVVGFDESKNPAYRAFEYVGHALGVGQHFQMFGMPPIEDAWFIYRATLRNGQVRDIFLGGREWTEGQPLSGRDSIPHHHWRQIHRNLTDGTCYFVRQRMAEFMVEGWNAKHPPEEQVVSMRLESYFDQFWPTSIPGEVRGALIWGTYPDSPTNAFESMLNRSLQGESLQGF